MIEIQFRLNYIIINTTVIILNYQFKTCLKQKKDRQIAGLFLYIIKYFIQNSLVKSNLFLSQAFCLQDLRNLPDTSKMK